MMEDIATLKAEIDRLRERLIENDIDPEPYVPVPSQFGPPTLMEHIMHEAVRRSANAFLANMPTYDYAKTIGPIGSTIRIRLPNDFTVTRSRL